MKILKRFFNLCLILILISACNTDYPEISADIEVTKSQTKNEVEVINNLLESIKPELQSRASTLEEFEFITFEVVKNMKTKVITLENFKEVRLFPITDLMSGQRSTYVISCFNGGDGSDDWEAECTGVSSCGKLIKKCLDQGGCAQVCEIKSGNGQSYASVELTFIPGKQMQ